MSLDLEPIKKRLKAATPGPWKWMEDAFRPKYMRKLKSGRWRARPGRSADESWAMLLCGPRRKLEAEDYFPPIDAWAAAVDGGFPDEWDYPHIIALRWSKVRGKELFNATPLPENAALIENAPTDIAALVAEVEMLRETIAAMCEKKEVH